MDNNLIYQLALTKIPGIGAVNARSLIAYCGGIKEVFSKSKSFLQKAPGVGSILAQNVKSFNDFKRIEDELAFIEKHTIRSVFFLDEAYPTRLKNIPDGPLVLYVRGQADLNPQRCIAVVGTRNMTEYGKQFVNKLTDDLVQHDATVISGLAYGVDVWTHKQCVRKGIQTFGVVAHGLDRMYPRSHAGIAKQMIEEGGAILTEYMTGVEPFHAHFPCRNRIVAGMVDAVIVVESARRGGSLITGELANQYNRDVFAVPGNVGSRYSAGCNYLIKQHKAHVIDDITDVVQMLNWDVQVKKTNQRQLFVELSDNEQKVVNAMKDKGEMGVDDLFAEANLSSSQLAMSLLELEMKNCISSLPGKRYQLI